MRGLRGDLAAGDFDLAVGTPGGAWAAAPAPASVTRRAGAGTAGSDRVTLTWADGVIKNTWLRVTMKADAQTGLSAPDVFYFGNLIGETGDGNGAGGTLRVNALDLGAVKRALNTTSTLDGRYDFNRDGRVNALDLGIVKKYLNRTLAAAVLPPLPVPSSATPGATSALREAEASNLLG